MRLNSVDALAGKTDDPRVRETLTYALRYDSNPGVRLHSLDELGAYVKDDIRVRNAVLEALLNDSNLGVRSSALHSLEPVKTDSSVRMALQQLAKEDPSDYIRTESSACWPRCRRCTDNFHDKGTPNRSGGQPPVEHLGSVNGDATLLMAVAIPLCAQTPRVFRDGNSWVEETTGTLPAGREFRAFTDMGSVQVQGSGTQVSYVVRKRSYANYGRGGAATVSSSCGFRRTRRATRSSSKAG